MTEKTTTETDDEEPNPLAIIQGCRQHLAEHLAAMDKAGAIKKDRLMLMTIEMSRSFEALARLCIEKGLFTAYELQVMQAETMTEEVERSLNAKKVFKKAILHA